MRHVPGMRRRADKTVEPYGHSVPAGHSRHESAFAITSTDFLYRPASQISQLTYGTVELVRGGQTSQMGWPRSRWNGSQLASPKKDLKCPGRQGLQPLANEPGAPFGSAGVFVWDQPIWALDFYSQLAHERRGNRSVRLAFAEIEAKPKTSQTGRGHLCDVPAACRRANRHWQGMPRCVIVQLGCEPSQVREQVALSRDGVPQRQPFDIA
eukprot:scaffold38786_cov31-Tisochrysis_lutea.AAC.3